MNNQCSFVSVKHHLRKAWRGKIQTTQDDLFVALDICKDCPLFKDDLQVRTHLPNC